MKKYVNGTYIEMTPEEVAEMGEWPPQQEGPYIPTPEERISALEENKAERTDLENLAKSIERGLTV